MKDNNKQGWQGGQAGQGGQQGTKSPQQGTTQKPGMQPGQPARPQAGKTPQTGTGFPRKDDTSKR